MTQEDIVAKFAHALNNFDSIDRQPSDTDLTRLREASAPLLLQILYDETGAVHNLICRICLEAAYTARYVEALPDPTRVEAYNPNIDDNATAIVCARSKASHKAKRVDRAAFETARWETTQFVLAVIADTWVCELRYSDSLYTEVSPKDLFSHLQAGYTCRHALDLLDMHNKIQRYHLRVERIPEYINMLEDAQRQAIREGRTIADEMLLLFTSIATLTGERFPRANDNWEDCAERDKK